MDLKAKVMDCGLFSLFEYFFSYVCMSIIKMIIFLYKAIFPRSVNASNIFGNNVTKNRE